MLFVDGIRSTLVVSGAQGAAFLERGRVFQFGSVFDFATLRRGCFCHAGTRRFRFYFGGTGGGGVGAGAGGAGGVIDFSNSPIS